MHVIICERSRRDVWLGVSPPGTQHALREFLGLELLRDFPVVIQHVLELRDDVRLVLAILLFRQGNGLGMEPRGRGPELAL